MKQHMEVGYLLFLIPILILIPFLLALILLASPRRACASGASPISLVRVADLDSSIVEDMRYATENNFTGKKLYPCALCLLRRETAAKLAAANAEFGERGCRIKVWDAYRPLSVQKLFWELIPDEDYVAPPSRGSRHNRGGAVDITLVDSSGAELLMPSEFDDLTARAGRDYPDMPAEARRNMEYLTAVMARHGFVFIDSEWWHFEDSDAKDFPLLDVPLEEYLAGTPANTSRPPEDGSPGTKHSLG